MSKDRGLSSISIKITVQFFYLFYACNCCVRIYEPRKETRQFYPKCDSYLLTSTATLHHFKAIDEVPD